MAWGHAYGSSAAGSGGASSRVPAAERNGAVANPRLGWHVLVTNNYNELSSDDVARLIQLLLDAAIGDLVHTRRNAVGAGGEGRDPPRAEVRDRRRPQEIADNVSTLIAGDHRGLLSGIGAGACRGDVVEQEIGEHLGDGLARVVGHLERGAAGVEVDDRVWTRPTRALHADCSAGGTAVASTRAARSRQARMMNVPIATCSRRAAWKTRLRSAGNIRMDVVTRWGARYVRRRRREIIFAISRHHTRAVVTIDFGRYILQTEGTMDISRRRKLRTPEARVRWVLRFVARSLPSRSSGAWRSAWDGLFAQSHPAHPDVLPRMPHPDALEDAHRRLRDCVEALANGRHFVVEPAVRHWTFLPPARRPTGARDSAPITRDPGWGRFEYKHIPSAAVFALVDDLNAIGADRLRACPLETEGGRCGTVFLATRGQVYCCRPHALAAAWKRYEPKRKMRR